jgi:hypothetical protein
MVLQGDAWHEKNSNVDMLVLRAVEGEENTYVRAASMRLNHYAGYRPPEVEFDPSPLHTLRVRVVDGGTGLHSWLRSVCWSSSYHRPSWNFWLSLKNVMLVNAFESVRNLCR